MTQLNYKNYIHVIGVLKENSNLTSYFLPSLLGHIFGQTNLTTKIDVGMVQFAWYSYI